MSKLALMLTSCGLLFNFVSAKSNNVCKNIMDYNTKLHNRNCWYNPDVDRGMLDLITQNGYPAEEYEVITADGYKLKLFRIPYGRKLDQNNTRSKQPVFLQHGILVSSVLWVFAGNLSYGFVLADQGYDVWMGNSRGNTYGNGHVSLSLDDYRYWNFSYHEMGIYDISSNLDFIYNKTGRNDIIYIGHSMGTNLAYVYASELLKQAEKRLKLIVALAPTLFLGQAITPFKYLTKFWPLLQWLNKFLKIKELLPNSPIMKTLTNLVCFQSGLQIFICESFISLMFGFDYENFRHDMLPVFFEHYPAGGSLNTVIQVCQGMASDRFAHYDYGLDLNTKYYNSTTPPDYNLSRVTIPSYIMYGVNDWTASEKDTIKLYNNLPGKKQLYKIKDHRYTHMDFYFAENLESEIILPLLHELETYRS